MSGAKYVLEMTCKKEAFEKKGPLAVQQSSACGGAAVAVPVAAWPLWRWLWCEAGVRLGGLEFGFGLGWGGVRLG